ncbi:MAG: beta-phosphoglucomutase family hydrolase [Candidatus Marinimicrobia bacterium]|nr:beta-phosphoglucomutase family hydrolase [Candidatus Neomarinimicrobiota bacterium]
MELKPGQEVPSISRDYQGVIFDLDGVITQTAKVHARAWKKMFDQFLEKLAREEDTDYDPLDIETDYPKYIDGIPRYDGVREFLQSRDIELPHGSPSDPPDERTICGLGNRKNELFLETLEEQGAEVYEDTVTMIKKWRDDGLNTAVISSSKNCKPVLETAGLLNLFDARVDGVIAAELDMPGKPEPDIFIEAAGRLGHSPAECVVFEDAIAGVKSASNGGIGLVVGVARKDNDEELLKNGADITVTKLTELDK